MVKESWNIENKGTGNKIYMECCQNWLENDSIEISSALLWLVLKMETSQWLAGNSVWVDNETINS